MISRIKEKIKSSKKRTKVGVVTTLVTALCFLLTGEGQLCAYCVGLFI